MNFRISLRPIWYDLTMFPISLCLRQLIDFRARGPVIGSVAYVWQWWLGRGHSLANQLEDSFSALLGIHPVFTFSLPQSSSWDSEWSPLPLGHQVCKFICVYLSAGSARNTSTQNSNITNQISNINKVRELKLDMRKISNDMEEMCGILNLYMYEDLNYR